ncbi:MAG: sulfotransferase family protein [Steroidobacteraceae bacterium]
MAFGEKWKRRLLSRPDRASQWLNLRRKDVAWLFRGRSFERRVPRLLAEHRWIFLVGCNNSGTTLIHDALADTGQFSFMPHEGQRYTSVLKRAEKRGFQRVWSEYVGELQLDERHPTTDVPRLLFDWLGELALPLKPLILEKTTANAVRMRWLQRAFPGAAFLGIVRNGYAVVEGIKRKGGKTVVRGARHWRKVNEMMLEDAEHLNRFLLVRYEDFVAAPRSELFRIAEFLDLRLDRIRAARTSIQDMNAQSISRLDEAELRVITHEAGDCLERMGYARLVEAQ